LEAIVPNIDKTAKLVQEITAASKEQNSGAEQVNNALQELNNVVQKNAAASEEITHNADDLSNKGNELKEAISFFKIDDAAIRKGMVSTTDTASDNPTTASRNQHMSSPAQQPTIAPTAIPTKNTGIEIKLDDNFGVDDEYEKF